MGIRYTKTEKDDDKKERTVPAEDFVSRLIASARKKETIIELPKTEIKK